MTQDCGGAGDFSIRFAIPLFTGDRAKTGFAQVEDCSRRHSAGSVAVTFRKRIRLSLWSVR
jgi:hypothetical protein